MNLDPARALDVTARLAAIAAFVGNCEALAARRMFAYTGVFYIGGVQILHWKHNRVLAVLGGFEARLLFLGALGCLAVAALGPWSAIGCAGLVTTIIVRLIMGQRRILGSDGAEQLISIILIAVMLSALPPVSQTKTNLTVGFIAAQLVLCYTTSGLSKLASPIWRSGMAVGDIISTQTYGLQPAARALQRIPLGSLALGWAVIIFETAFVAALFGPPWLVFSALGVAFIFHVSCATVMGLNDFLWAFPSTYPCVLVLSQWLP